MTIIGGRNLIAGYAWSGYGKISKVEVGTDDGTTWKVALLSQPVLSKAQARFQLEWSWNGQPTIIVRRARDDKGNLQPDRESFIDRTGTNAVFHYNAQQTWCIDSAGRVRNVLA